MYPGPRKENLVKQPSALAFGEGLYSPPNVKQQMREGLAVAQKPQRHSPENLQNSDICLWDPFNVEQDGELQPEKKVSLLEIQMKHQLQDSQEELRKYWKSMEALLKGRLTRNSLRVSLKTCRISRIMTLQKQQWPPCLTGCCSGCF